MRTVEVRDHLNPKRLLGTMVNQPDRRPVMRDIRYPIYEPPSSWIVSDEVFSAELKTVTLTFGHRPSDDGWDHLGVYLTHDSIKSLMTLPAFRLPGEDERQAQLRLRYR